MTDTAQQSQQSPPQYTRYEPPRPSALARMRNLGFRGIVLVLLGVTALGTSYDAWLSHQSVEQGREVSCTYLSYDWDSDEDESVKTSFSDLAAEDRALADIYECDIEGR